MARLTAVWPKLASVLSICASLDPSARSSAADILLAIVAAEPPMLRCPRCHEEFAKVGKSRPMQLPCGHFTCCDVSKVEVDPLPVEEDDEGDESYGCPVCKTRYSKKKVSLGVLYTPPG